MKIKNKLTCIIIIMIIFISSILVFVNINAKKYNNSLEDNVSLYSEIVLPPGSDVNDLQNAVDNSEPGDIIIISSSMNFGGLGVFVRSEKDVTIQSNASNNWTLSQTERSQFHFRVQGNLTLQNITLDGGTTGGRIYADRGNVTLNSGAIVQNCSSQDVGGGISISNGGSVTMNGNSVVKNSTAITAGGAVAVSRGTFTMNDDSIITNCKTTSTRTSIGGGVYLGLQSTFIMNNNSTITECSSNQNGGGAYIGSSTFIMNSGNIINNTAVLGAGIYISASNATLENALISGNTANTNGGGIYLTEDATIENVRNTSITNNSATNGTGGGIYTQDKRYTNLVTENTTSFNNNMASKDETPPIDAETLYPDIKFASTSIFTHPLNNYDINYEAVYSVIYNANGGTGSHTVPDIVPGEKITVLSLTDTGIERLNYTFIGWNTESDGSGINYAPGDEITITKNITLYAKWVLNEYSAHFNSNGGSSVASQTVSYGDKITKPPDPTREGYTFDGWYTDDGIFENEWDFDTPVTSDVILYAKWVEAHNCKCIWICMSIILIICIAFCRQIRRFIKCIICIIKKWIKCLKCKCNYKNKYKK